MSSTPDTLTKEQIRIVEHQGCTFVSACPGAGKTRVLVERARVLLKDRSTGKGVAFLSFTNAAVSEFEKRLRREGLLPSPVFPHFVGTFDGFLWQFLVAPFGVEGCDKIPRIIPDLDEKKVQPFDRAQPLPLSCFDRATGEIIPGEARRRGFDPDRRAAAQAKAYVTTAAKIRQRCRSRGQLDFADARRLADERLKDGNLSSRLAAALAARFREIVVDEAQDCNPKDLEIIQWLRDAGIATKVICDPHQSIYEFRGGVTKELDTFGATFDASDRLSINGNFRSSEPICNAIVALRPRHARVNRDRAVGKYRLVDAPVRILAYPGRGVPASVGSKFRDIVDSEGLDFSSCPVLASTWDSARKAIGQPTGAARQDLTLRLAVAVSSFHCNFETGNRRAALEDVHRVVLELGGKLDGRTYRQYLDAEGLEPGAWRPRVLKLVRDLHYDPTRYPDPESWLKRARALLKPYLLDDGQSISQRLKRNSDLAAVLAVPGTSDLQAMSIHAVKGQEFPGVCVVMTASTSSGILDYLETGARVESAEEARKIYVAASRAQRLLCIAIPRSQADRLETHLRTTGAPVERCVLTPENP